MGGWGCAFLGYKNRAGETPPSSKYEENLKAFLPRSVDNNNNYYYYNSYKMYNKRKYTSKP